MINLPIIWPQPGRYLLAVSGGADSMVLLDVMAGAAAARGYQLTVGHVDHGLRAESAADRQFVEAAAARYGLSFTHHAAALKPGASEATARQARHNWLQAEAVRQQASVVTAHHQDDLLETSLLNLARGTGRRGLAPMQTGPVVRPLLGASRAQLRAYATERAITWREDPTNAELANPRNLLRHRLLPAAPAHWREHYLEKMQQLTALNQQIDAELDQHIPGGESEIVWSVAVLRELELDELAELLAQAALRLQPDAELNRRALDELALFAKTARSGRSRPLTNRLWLARQHDQMRLYSQVKSFGLPQSR